METREGAVGFCQRAWDDIWEGFWKGWGGGERAFRAKEGGCPLEWEHEFTAFSSCIPCIQHTVGAQCVLAE